MEIYKKIAALMSLVKARKPLVHHITNYVTVNDCANAVLAMGGSPVMADAWEEAADMVDAADALVLNLGTLNDKTIKSMFAAGERAKELGVPVVLDPVGAGATALRINTAEKLIRELNPEVIRGNMSEIMALGGIRVAIKGVDSLVEEKGGLEGTEGSDKRGSSDIVKKIAAQLGCVIAATGKTDVISDGGTVCLLDNGHRMMTELTGTGCMTTSLVGVFCGVTQDYYAAAIAGLISMGLSGELAQISLKKGEGIGTFRAKLMDKIYTLTPEMIEAKGKIRYG